MHRWHSALLMLAAGGCGLQPGGSTPTAIPESVLTSCPSFSEDAVRDSMAAVELDRDQGFSRNDSFTAFQHGCEVTFPDDMAVQACTTCGEAIYDVVYADS